jgi:hypothetical protein
MAEIKQVNGRTVVDYMARDYDSLLQSMRALIPSKLPEWTDYASEADFGNVLLQLFAHMGDILSYYQDRIANESFLGTAQTRRSIIHHLNLIGYRLATAAPAAAQLVVTVPTTVNDTVTINRGDAFATRSQPAKPSVRFEYTRDTPLTINCATLPPDPANSSRKIFADGIPVEEGRLVKDEELGISDGTPNQRFPLLHAGIILRSLGPAQQINQDILLLTELGGAIDTWTPQESLAFSREAQRDYVLEIDEDDRAVVQFGDGKLSGAIPPSGSVIRATYRVGGGRRGNVAANTIQTIVDAPQLALLGMRATNPAPATGGAERESIEHAVTHAPGVFRSLKRAVTAGDYEALALNFSGVGKVRAVATGWNDVTLFIAPVEGGQVSDIFAANLLAYFEDKRPISTIIEIADVDYVPIYATAHVGVQSYYSRADVTEKVRAAAGSLLAFANVDFKQTIYLSKFYEAIEMVEGVAFVNITEFRPEGQPPGSIEDNGKIELGVNAIPTIPAGPDYVGGIKLSAEGGY